jgi:hypothetical protein
MVTAEMVGVGVAAGEILVNVAVASGKGIVSNKDRRLNGSVVEFCPRWRLVQRSNSDFAYRLMDF